MGNHNQQRVDDNHRVSLGSYNGNDFSEYDINEQGIVFKGQTMVNTHPAPFGYRVVFFTDKLTGTSKLVRIHVLLANSFMQERNSDERDLVVYHINTDANDHQINSLRIATTHEEMVNIPGVPVVSTNKNTGENISFNSIMQCVQHYALTYPNLRHYITQSMVYEEAEHLFIVGSEMDTDDWQTTLPRR